MNKQIKLKTVFVHPVWMMANFSIVYDLLPLGFALSK